jgi:hypothetical protein
MGELSGMTVLKGDVGHAWKWRWPVERNKGQRCVWLKRDWMMPTPHGPERVPFQYRPLRWWNPLDWRFVRRAERRWVPGFDGATGEVVKP